MRLHLLALILISSAIQIPPSTNVRIEGRVLRTATNEPISNTPVTLISSTGLSDAALASLLDQMSQLVTAGLQGQGGGGSQNFTIFQVATLLQRAGPNVSTQASVLSDRAGHFEFSDLPPGRYTIWVQRFNYFGPLQNGFLSSTASTTVSLDGSKAIPPIDLFLTPGLAISGRVVNPLGQPASGMPITAYRSTFTEGKASWLPVVSRPIDDRGEYRLSPLSPGEYYVGVSPPQTIVVPEGQQPPIRTFFPGVSEPSEATRLTLKIGDMPRVDFTLRSAPAASFRISGFAVNPSPTRTPAGVVDNGYSAFLLTPIDSNLIDSFSPYILSNTAAANGRTAGEFELRNARPGIYELFPNVIGAGYLPGRTIVDARSSDVSGVRILVERDVRIEGRIRILEGNPQLPVNLNEVRIVLRQWSELPLVSSRAMTLTVDERGEFAGTGPAGLPVLLQVLGLPDTAYVADVRVGTTSVMSAGFGISSSDPIQVVIDATTGATLDTTVQTPDGRPAPRARVVLVPAEDQRRNPQRYKAGMTDGGGRLVIRGVAPGAYTAYAWESIPDTAWLNREFLSKYQDQGVAVTLLPSAQAKLQLKWISFETDQR